MLAAFFAIGEALIDAVTVGLVGDDENPAVGRAAEAESRTTQARIAVNGSHVHRGMRGCPHSIDTKR